MPRHQHAPPGTAPRRTWKQSASLGLALLGLFVLALLYGFGALDRRRAMAATLAHHRTDSEQSLKGGT